MDTFQIGAEVEIIDGFLAGHSGKISEVGESEVTVIVTTIGREMPVSLDAKSVKKK
jgi:transcription antitermination factor NusG